MSRKTHCMRTHLMLLSGLSPGLAFVPPFVFYMTKRVFVQPDRIVLASDLLIEAVDSHGTKVH